MLNDNLTKMVNPKYVKTSGDFGSRPFPHNFDKFVVKAFGLAPRKAMNYRKGQTFFVRGGQGSYIYVIQSRILAVSFRDEGGPRQISEFLFNGSFYGFTQNGMHECWCEVISADSGVSLNKDDFQIIIQRSPTLRSEMQRQWIAVLNKVNQLTFLLGKMVSLETLALFILERQDSIPDGSGKYMVDVIRLPMNRQGIADYLGFRIITVSHAFASLKGMTHITFGASKATTILDTNGLTTLVNFHTNPFI